jgi:2-C-methyl-D-erythritol 4-phosphate cytidylyltransferase
MMSVEALLQAAGGGTRLGLGPKAFVNLDGKPLIVRAVQTLLDVVDRVIVAVPPAEIERMNSLIGSQRVVIIHGGSSRSETTRLLVGAATAPWLVLHDVVHPFVTKELIQSVLEAAYECGASAPAVPNSEFLYSRSGELLHAPGEVFIGQKPVAFGRDAVIEGYRLAENSTHGDPSLLQILALAGVRTKFVAGSARNIKITTAADLDFASALIALEKSL